MFKTLAIEDRIYPADRLHPGIAADLVAAFPDVLLIYHPFFRRWQLYATTRRSDWTARRLVNAIVTEHEHAQRPDEHPKAFWWRWRGAPELVEDLPREPGSWLLDWLREASSMTAAEFLRAYEERQHRRREGRKREIHDLHRGIADDSYRHVRDAMRGDPLAGRRKWVAPVQIDLKGA